RLMNNHFDLDTGEKVADPKEGFLAENFPEESKKRHELMQISPKNGHKEFRLAKTKLAKMNKDLDRKSMKLLQKADAPKLISVGKEGLYSWNWQYLGDRRFGSVGVSNSQGTNFAWNPKGTASLQLERQSKTFRLTFIPAEGKNLIQRLNEGFFVNSVALCDNAIVVGGRIVAFDKKNSEQKGFIQVFDQKDPKKVWTKKFAAGLSFNGLSISDGQVAASFDDGSLVLLK
ncbi:MAG: hypothetical protein HQL32_15850, partial [Planctomycetes bacterium]|nr:hypothetical protein [Planctomycetota bacterium]